MCGVRTAIVSRKHYYLQFWHYIRYVNVILEVPLFINVTPDYIFFCSSYNCKDDLKITEKYKGKVVPVSKHHTIRT
jgi:hypothetical protein